MCLGNVGDGTLCVCVYNLRDCSLRRYVGRLGVGSVRLWILVVGLGVQGGSLGILGG